MDAKSIVDGTFKKKITKFKLIGALDKILDIFKEQAEFQGATIQYSIHNSHTMEDDFDWRLHENDLGLLNPVIYGDVGRLE